MIPNDLNQSKVLAELEEVVNKLAPKFIFGFNDIEDIKQDARILGLQALVKYNRDLPLKPFLYIHIRNRLLNQVRKKLRRSDSPCKKCHQKIQGHTDHADGKYCPIYETWKKRNDDKAGIMEPEDLDFYSENKHYETDYVGKMSHDDIINIINLKLPVSLRKYFLQMLAKISVPKVKRDKVISSIKEIFTEDEITDIIKSED